MVLARETERSAVPRILIADDHEIIREGVRALLSRSRPDWEICGEATNGREAVEAVRAEKPDVAVLDVTMPVMNGLEAASKIANLGLGCRILIFTMHEGSQLATRFGRPVRMVAFKSPRRLGIS